MNLSHFFQRTKKISVTYLDLKEMKEKKNYLWNCNWMRNKTIFLTEIFHTNWSKGKKKERAFFCEWKNLYSTGHSVVRSLCSFASTAYSTVRSLTPRRKLRLLSTFMGSLNHIAHSGYCINEERKEMWKIKLNDREQISGNESKETKVDPVFNRIKIPMSQNVSHPYIIIIKIRERILRPDVWERETEAETERSGWDGAGDKWEKQTETHANRQTNRKTDRQ